VLQVLLGAALPAALAQAQELSADGNRWYEVEVSIFAIEAPRGPNSEQPVSSNTRAVYLPRLQALVPPASSYQVEFAVAAAPATEPLPLLSPAAGGFAQPLVLAADAPAPLLGPIHSPALRDSFRVLDAAYDPYLELDTSNGQFGPLNRNLQNSGDYRVLWHRLWRQPMLGRNQVRTVFVAGGSQYGSHMEVEGSIRLSDGGNAGRAMLDLNIWMNSFRRGGPTEDSQWQLPELPLPVPGLLPPIEALQSAEGNRLALPLVEEWGLTEVWQQEESRELVPGQLYYIDHPALGVLVEIRPYVLPVRETLLPEEEF
jgi:hypothetical protein